MPSLGADMTEGTLLEWLVQPGDVVHRGDIVAVVDTAKSAIDVEVFQDGRIVELLVDPGTTVPVGAPLARLDEVSGSAAEPTPSPAAASPVVHHDAHVPASPFARRRAVELGIDLSTVTGHGGVISVADVERAAAKEPDSGGAHQPEPLPPVDPTLTPTPAPTPVPPAGSPRPEPSSPRPAPSRAMHGTAMREAIAALMARSKREIPHYYLTWDLDLGDAMAWLAARNADRAVDARVVPAALLLKAVAHAAAEFPEMNGLFVDGAFRPAEQVNLGVAVALRGGGLIAPALSGADHLDLDTLMDRMKDLVARARGGRLRSSEMSDATITVTNLGDRGAQAVHGVIYPPQVALVGFGRIEDRPAAVHGLLGVRPMATATLAADHRVSDGHRGGLFLERIGELLGSPASLEGART